MKTNAALAAFAGLLATTNAQLFGLMSARSGSPIHLQQINANGEHLWIGKKTASFCPSKVVHDCPAGTSTTFAGGDSSLAMGAEVPGGQLVYVDPSCGAVGYTIAHSSAEPKGAINNGWTLSQGEQFGVLSWKNGLLACSTKGNSSQGPWQIFARVHGVKFSDDECLGFDALTVNETKPAAWQYT